MGLANIYRDGRKISASIPMAESSRPELEARREILVKEAEANCFGLSLRNDRDSDFKIGPSNLSRPPGLGRIYPASSERQQARSRLRSRLARHGA